MAVCPYHSTLANGMRSFPASHPCLTVYDPPRTASPKDTAALDQGNQP